MRFITKAGAMVKGRRAVSQSSSIHPEEVKTPEGIAAAFRDTMTRLSDLESAGVPDALEFEKNVGSGGAAVKLFHGFGGPVRYWVTYWTRQVGGAYPTTAPILVAQADSTADELSLKSYVAGRAIIRVEASPVGIEL